MANQIDAGELFNRLVAIETEMVESDAVPYPFHQQEGYPYWTNSLPSLDLDRSPDNFGEQATDAVATVTAILAIGALTSGESGEREAEYVRLTFYMARYFNARAKLQSRLYPLGMAFTHYMECTNITRREGERDGVRVLLAFCTLVIHMFEPLQQAYY